jgi:hypothetical protein
LVYFTAIWFILWPFVFYGHLVYLSRFGMLYLGRSGNPIPRIIFSAFW